MSAVAMKYQHTDLDGGVTERHTPNAKLNAKVAYAIFTGMVKDKDAYPVRELCKNAQEVTPPGKPFEVHLPSAVDPTFRVRDYGPGLTHHFMMYRFPKLGDSTKDGNGVNGLSGWGFGSKSPFAKLFEDGMNGSYNVTSYQKGIVRHYVVSLDAGGMPQIKMLAEDETTEPNGLEVFFAVPYRDVHRFAEKAREVLWSFEPRPIITPKPDAKWSNPVVLDQGDGWTRYHRDSVPFSGPHVRVDRCVMYPIDLAQMDGASCIDARECIVFEVAADAVQATASRESLQYTSSTKDTLRAVMVAYSDGLAQHISDEVAKQSNYFSACEKVSVLLTGLNSVMRELVRSQLEWHGRKLDLGFNFRAKLLSNGWDIVDGKPLKFEKEFLNCSDIAGCNMVIQWSNDRNAERFLASGLIGQPIVWIRMKRRDLPAFLAEYDLTLDDVFLLDAVEVPELPKSTKSMIRQREKFVYTNGHVDVKMLPVDLAKGGYYIRKVRQFHRSRSFNYISVGRSVSEYLLHEAIQLAIKLGVMSVQDTIMIKRKDEILGDNWVDLGNVLFDGLKDKFDPALVKAGAEAYNRLNRVVRQLSEINDTVDNFPDDIATLIDHVRALKSVTLSPEEQLNAELLAMLAKLNIQVEADAAANPVEGVESEFEDLNKKYRLLYLIVNQWGHYGPNQSQKDTLKHYFDLCAAYYTTKNETGVQSS